ncbi:MAG: D-threo-aldose 1-dehydrogenase [Acidimicrobiaceae bacterium]|jgi:aryl-alcohol dehydrogenase-like predicted oxidoreductase|nr:D-threo-aldose 1-dehydrogenase [Acidimicrobiaceae bacterium]
MIEHAQFGRTGHSSTRVVFGGAALGGVSQDTADEVLEVLRGYGVNHLDTAASYGDSELRIAPWLVGHRDEYFLATKTGERGGLAARAELERSLTRLGVDHVDLVQLHNLVEEDEWIEAHGPDGALAALTLARDEGLVRFIGVTGHGTRIARMHLRSLGRFDYDSVLLPYNFTMLADDQYRADVEELLALCAERNVAVQTIKSVARGRWPQDAPGERRSWYEPIEDPGAIAHAVHYVLERPGLFLASSSDYTLLRHILEAASHPAPALPEQMLADTQAFDISRLFDGNELERM